MAVEVTTAKAWFFLLVEEPIGNISPLQWLRSVMTGLVPERENLFESIQQLKVGVGDPLAHEGSEQADAFMLFVKTAHWGVEVTRALRSNPGCFLKPILLLSDVSIAELDSLVDAAVVLPAPYESLRSTIDQIASISQKVKNLASVPEDIEKGRLHEILLLQFLHSRGDPALKPERDPMSSLGYSYPLVYTLISGTPGEETTIMENLQEAHLLRADLIDKVNLCPFCEHVQINFREVCPHCHSLSIKEEATIHHYRCAYVGRENEFITGYDLKCPKCGKKLRHIGVDYDKPTENLWCEACGSNFVDPLIRCLCFHCGNVFSPEDTLLKEIKEFSLTPEGSRAAEEGLLPGVGLVDILRHEVGFYKLEVFKELVRLEALRCKRYKYESTLAYLKIGNADEIIAEEGIGRTRELWKEFARFFQETFRDTDILTDIDEINNEYMIMLTHTSPSGAEVAIKNLMERSGSLFTRNLAFEYRLANLAEEEQETEELLERLRQSG